MSLPVTVDLLLYHFHYTCAVCFLEAWPTSLLLKRQWRGVTTQCSAGHSLLKSVRRQQCFSYDVCERLERCEWLTTSFERVEVLGEVTAWVKTDFSASGESHNDLYDCGLKVLCEVASDGVGVCI